MSKSKGHGGAALLVVLAAFAAAGGQSHHHAGKSTGGSELTTSAVGYSTGSNVDLARRMAANYGWTGSQWSCLDALWTRESGFRMVWNTAGSGAYGIPQALPASKMASAGADYMTNPRTQIRWGLRYIRGTYGTPCGAWEHEVRHSWY